MIMTDLYSNLLPHIIDPNLQDHAAAIASSDRFDHFLITNGLRTLRNNLAEVLLTLKENWSKVSDPKGLEGGGGMGMY